MTVESILKIKNDPEFLTKFNSFGLTQTKFEDGELLFWVTEHKGGYAKVWWTADMLMTEHLMVINIIISNIYD